MSEVKYYTPPTGPKGTKLECACDPTDKDHRAYTDKNGEVVVECGECGRFIKLPKEFAPKE